MDRKSILVSTLVGFLGLLSAVLGFVAEANRIKGWQVKYSSPTECVYPRSPALALGLSAAVFLLNGHIIINLATGCRRGPHLSTSNRTLATVCLVVSWLTFAIGFFLLVAGAALNDKHEEENVYFGSYNCYVLKPGVFAGAAVLSLTSIILGIVYYMNLSFNSTKDENETVAGIALGQPQHPVFVHQDTYDRRQLS